MVTQEKSNNILFYVFFMKVNNFSKKTMKQQLKLSSTFNLGSFFMGKLDIGRWLIPINAYIYQLTFLCILETPGRCIL